MSEIYDVIILGAGPAGLAAGLYAGRSRLNVLIIEKGQDGGQIAITDEIENYPGQIVEGESGPSLIARMTEQAEKFGAKRVSDMIKEVELEGEVKVLKSEKNEYRGKNVIIATGAHARPIGCKGEGQFRGKGVSYCATCDGAFFRNKVTAVVGGGNVALEDAIFLSRMCKKVYLIHRRDEFRGAKILQDEVKKNDKIEILWNTIVTKIDGDEVVEGLHIQDVDNHVDKLLDVDGIFIAVGTKPASELLSGKLSTDEKGYIIAGEDGVTNIPGIFAAGDGRSKNLRQVVTAVSDGANCVYSVERYLQNA